MPLPAVFQKNVSIAGREIPLVIPLIGAAGVAALITLRRKGAVGNTVTSTPPVSGTTGGLTSAELQTQFEQMAAQTQTQIGGVRSEFDASIAQARSDFLGALSTQVGQVQSQFQQGLAGLQSQTDQRLSDIQGSVTALRGDVQQQLTAQAAAIQQSGQTTSANLNALSARVVTLEAGKSRDEKAIRNLMRYEENLTSGLLASGAIDNAFYNQIVTPYVQQIVTRYPALGADYEAF